MMARMFGKIIFTSLACWTPSSLAERLLPEKDQLLMLQSIARCSGVDCDLPVQRSTATTEEVGFSCKQEASREPWTTKTTRVAYVLRGEAFRSLGHLWKGEADIAQGGPGHRTTCGDGAREAQGNTTEWHLREVDYIESLGFNVTILGTTYPCSEGNSDYTVQDELAKLYKGRLLHLNVLDKRTSSQQVGLSDALRLAMDEVQRSEQAFEYVVVKRWDARDDVSSFCHLQEGFQKLQDLGSFHPGSNIDTLFIVPRLQTPCFAEFLARPRGSISPCCDDDDDAHACLPGGCAGCSKTFAAIMYNTSWQRDQFHSCPPATINKFAYPALTATKSVTHEDADPYASLPQSTRDCLKQKGKLAVDENTATATSRLKKA